ncbi:MAG: amidohydrolase, partial [Oligoflexia bacterium]|nr:amidohydrolase [Oligoflexia bacterium]
MSNNHHRDYVIKMRREFHANPQLSMEEYRTAKRFCEELTQMGIACEQIEGTNGICGCIESGTGPCLAIRADMDALSIDEKNDFPYRSQTPNVMHACGHDGHMAMLLGAAKILSEKRDEFCGKIKLIFQPAEENAKGAKLLIDKGVLTGVDHILGLHLWADLPCGTISIDSGFRMAGGDIFSIVVHGRGGHGGQPHKAVDAILVGAAIIMNLQSIISREIDPLNAVVISVGKFNAGQRFNVIAQESVLEGTVRYFSPLDGTALPHMIERIATNIARSFNANAELQYVHGSPPIFNDELGCILATEAANNINCKVVSMRASMLSEDFAYYLQHVPGHFAFIGASAAATST